MRKYIELRLTNSDVDYNLCKYLEEHVKSNQRVINVFPKYNPYGDFVHYMVYIEETVITQL